jgi:sulfatase modifying factor 1
MNKQFGLIITLACLIELPAQAQVAEKVAVIKPTHQAKSGRIFRDCPSCPQMVVIYSGRFTMGSPDSEDKRGNDEGPVHRVNIAAFAIGKYEITRSQFAEFVKQTHYSTGDKCWTLEKGDFAEHKGNWRKPGFPQKNSHPVTCVNWDDAQAYAKWLSGRTGKNYRLPTEAEWEYAARAHTQTARYWGDAPDDACKYANGADKTAQKKIDGASSWSTLQCTDGFAYTAPVGRFKANALGLNDMLGNVWEWTEDNYHENYHDAPSDGSAWLGGSTTLVLRGGS